MKTTELLEDMWFSTQQAELFVLVYQYGPKPASTLAQMIWIERTNTYKMLNVLVSKGLISQTTKQGTKQFFVWDEKIITHLIDQRKKELSSRESSSVVAQTELEQLTTQRVSSLPQLSFFEWKNGMRSFFEDMQAYVSDEDYRVVKFFASNTLESQSHAPQQLHEYTKQLFTDLEELGVRFEAYLWNGIMLLEHVLKTYEVDAFHELPAGSSSVQIFVVGEVVWIALFNQVPFGLRIENRPFADVIHFFFKQMG